MKAERVKIQRTQLQAYRLVVKGLRPLSGVGFALTGHALYEVRRNH
jgi:hypothetical protein